MIHVPYLLLSTEGKVHVSFIYFRFPSHLYLCANPFAKHVAQPIFRIDFNPTGFILQTQRPAVTVLQATPQGSNVHVNEIVSSKVFTLIIESFCRFLVLCNCSLPTFLLMNVLSLSPLLKEPHDARINLRTCHAIHSEWQEASCFYTEHFGAPRTFPFNFPSITIHLYQS